MLKYLSIIFLFTKTIFQVYIAMIHLFEIKIKILKNQDIFKFMKIL